jgi:Lrp/AsnC family leucine-responsive transcriptional regulator
MAVNRRRSGGSTEGSTLDATNRRLLVELQADARLSLAELGRRVGLSSPAVAERLQRLEDDGVILGYRARSGWR